MDQAHRFPPGREPAERSVALILLAGAVLLLAIGVGVFSFQPRAVRLPDALMAKIAALGTGLSDRDLVALIAGSAALCLLFALIALTRGSRASEDLVVSDDGDAEAFMASARPGFAWLGAAAVGVLVGLGAAALAYFGVYAPLQARLSAEQRATRTLIEAHTAEIATLGRDSAAREARLEALLLAEQSKATKALAAADQAQAEILVHKQAPEPEAAKPTVAKRKVPVRAKKRPTAKPRAQAAIEKPRVEKSEPPLDRESRRALRESTSNDPIGGLEGI